MSDQEENLESIERNANKSGISDKERKRILVGIKILSVLIIILTGFIIEALLNQHPVFEFLQYKIFQQESIILGSIALILLFLGYMVIGIVLGSLMLTDYQIKKNTYLIISIGIILFIASFIMLSYCELTRINYFSYLLIVTGTTGQMMVEIINKSQSSLSYYKLLKLISLILWICGLCLEGIYYSKQNL